MSLRSASVTAPIILHGAFIKRADWICTVPMPSPMNRKMYFGF